MTLGVYVPTLGRPHALQRVVDNVKAAATLPYRVVFVAETDDNASYHAALATGAEAVYNRYSPSYSNALQTAYELGTEKFFLNGNDDFDFQPGWDTQAVAAMVDGVGVVGIHDGKSGHSAIHLIRRQYIDEQSGVVDMPRRVYFPYQHNYVDTEMTQTAQHRGVWAACDGRIHHLHPAWGFAATDDTYEKSAATMNEDAETFRARQHLWS